MAKDSLFLLSQLKNFKFFHPFLLLSGTLVWIFVLVVLLTLCITVAWVFTLFILFVCICLTCPWFFWLLNWLCVQYVPLAFRVMEWFLLEWTRFSFFCFPEGGFEIILLFCNKLCLLWIFYRLLWLQKRGVSIEAIIYFYMKILPNIMAGYIAKFQRWFNALRNVLHFILSLWRKIKESAIVVYFKKQLKKSFGFLWNKLKHIPVFNKYFDRVARKILFKLWSYKTTIKVIYQFWTLYWPIIEEAYPWLPIVLWAVITYIIVLPILFYFFK